MQQPLNIFLLVGQSNMAGRGLIGEVAQLADPRIELTMHDGGVAAVPSGQGA